MIKVLIVDDELLMRIGLKSMIDWKKKGFNIVGEASNGKEALQIARDVLPDLIITDIKMPLMDGLTLIREVSQFLQQCQFVILSVMEEFQYVKEALHYGAVDYLVKSDLKKEQLLDVLNVVKRNDHRERSSSFEHTGQYKQSIHLLKENLFKEMLSGFRREEEFLSQINHLGIKVLPAHMILFKLKVKQFNLVREKYVEQDEQLLRFAIVNILEEVIPRKWNKEVIVENSADYLIIMNVEDLEGGTKEKLKLLIDKILGVMQDFLNISLAIGASSLIPGFKYLKVAYQEADFALKQYFYERERSVIFFDDMKHMPSRDREDTQVSKEAEQALKIAIGSSNYEQAELILNELRLKLDQELHTEKSIRNSYIRLLELINSHFPRNHNPQYEAFTPYEQLLYKDSFQDMHDFIITYFRHCVDETKVLENTYQSHTDLAIEIIMKYYADDISLRFVAERINVNPSYLSRIFKQETGENFTLFLTKVRMDKAKYYLDTMEYKVYEVANKVGYHNTTYFSKIFKKMVGLSPEEFRRQQRT